MTLKYLNSVPYKGLFKLMYTNELQLSPILITNKWTIITSYLLTLTG